MRVAVDSQRLAVEPGNSTALVVEVMNTDDVIDGISASLLGIPGDCVSASPALLPLFPDSTGQVTLDLAVPLSHPAGRHALTVEIVSHGTARPPRYIDVDLDVAAQPGLRMTARPKLLRARRSGRFVIELANYGNVPLDVTLTASDPDRQIQPTFTPPRRRIEPGAVAPTLLTVRGPRMFTGAEVDRNVVVEATARPITHRPAAMSAAGATLLAGEPATPLDDRPTEVIPAITDPITEPGAEPEAEAEGTDVTIVRQVPVQLRQRPLISRGLLTVLILLGIVALWASVFLLGLGKVFASDPMTKQAPASFFASLNNPAGGSSAAAGAGGTGGAGSSAGAGSGGGAAGGSGGSAAGGSAGGAPAGALGKSGQLPPGLGGEISGTVRATDNQQPVGRILVQAYRKGRTGLIQMSSAASQADGTYTLAGLFPTDYYIEFSAAGYRTQWYPNRPSQATAQRITAVAQGSTTGIDASVVGNPATVSGRVDPGDVLSPVTTTVTARPLLGGQTGRAVATARTDASGAYRLTKLPAPNSYEFTFTTPGYQSSTVVDSVAGGDQRLEPTVILGASNGQISGVVTDGTQPIGGAQVSTTVGGQPLTVLTPTTGQVGAYVLDNLPTPATYVITVSSPGHGTTTRIVDLTAGQSKTGLDFNLASGTGSLTGRVVGPNGKGLGGATVTVGGAVGAAGSTPTATTLTAGSPGSFVINGLAVPGSYTLTVSLDGYAAASVPLSLTTNGAPPAVTIRLAARLGSITGTITGESCKTFPGATITATNGKRSWTTTSNSADGGYLISDLDPGSYSVTVTASGEPQKTALVTVKAGKTQHQDLTFKTGVVLEMRIDVSPQRLEVSPGLSQTITITIANTETVIAGYAIRVLGADPGWVEIPAGDLALFPDESRAVAVTLDPPKGLPAGTRRIAVQVRELTPPYASRVTEIDMVVPAAPLVQVRMDPLAVTAGKRASFSLLVENTGNTEIKGLLSGDDPENQVRFDFEPERVTLAPGQHAVVDLRASAHRRFLGSPTVRMLSVYLDPVREDEFFAPTPDPPPATAEERNALAGATFIQKSVMSRGALSLLGLLFAATVFAIVITIALSRLVAQSTADRNLALQVAAAKNSSATTGQSGVSGAVTLLTSGKPVAGVAVSVFSAADTSVAIATTATDTKGSYRVTDLPAGKYKLSFRGAGFVQIWYPGAATDADATTVTLAANQVQAGLNVSLGGVPASISGTVVGDDVSAATLFLETVPAGTTPATASTSRLGQDPVQPVVPPDTGGAVVKQVPVGSDGTFSLTSVPSPSVYNLVVVKTGYATSTQRIDIGAGEARTGVQLTLSKGDGLITGTVTSQAGPLGGVTVTATAGQQTANTVSLTGTGAFTLRNLPTPATFTVVARDGGFASQTLTLSLGAGQRLTGVAITLSRSSASLKGLVTLLPHNTPAAGVGVTVTDGQVTVQTATESTDHIGSWAVGGLAVPGTYTVTFARSDLQSQTVSVSLDSSGNLTPGSLGARITADGITVGMQSATASVSGTIAQVGGGAVCNSKSDLGEASVSLSSGSSTYTVTSASVAPNCGKYRLEQLPPGTYTMTVSAGSGTSPSSQVITVAAGDALTKDVRLPSPASLAGTVTGCVNDDQAAGPCAGWTVFLYQQAQYATTVTATTTTASDGSFSFDDLEAGTYIVAVGPTADPSNATTTKKVAVQPSSARKGVTIVVTP